MTDEQTINIRILTQASMGGVKQASSGINSMTQETQQFTNMSENASDTSKIAFNTLVANVMMVTSELQRMTDAAEEFFTKMTDSFVEFQTQLAETQSILGDAGGGMEGLQNRIDEVSDSLDHGLTKTQLAKGAYDAYSAGVTDAADSQKLLKKSGKFAIVTHVEQAQAIRALTSSADAFSISYKNLDRIANVHFNTVKLGKLRYEDLLHSMGRLSAAGASAGQSLETTHAALVLMTKGGYNARQASTRVSAGFRALKQLTAEETQELENMGIEIYDASGNFRDMTNIVAQMKKAWGGLSDKQRINEMQMIKNKRATEFFSNAINMSDDFSKYRKQLNQTGKVEKEYNRTTETAAFKHKELENKMADLRVEMGEKTLPAEIKLMEARLWMIKSLDKLSQGWGKNALIATQYTQAILGMIMPIIQTAMMTAVLWQMIKQTDFSMKSLMKTIGTKIGLLQADTSSTSYNSAAVTTNTSALYANNSAMGTTISVQGADTTATEAHTSSWWGLNTAMYANPIGAIIAAIIAMVAVVAIIIIYWEEWKDLIDSCGIGLSRFYDTLKGIITTGEAWGNMLEWWGAKIANVTDKTHALTAALKMVPGVSGFIGGGSLSDLNPFQTSPGEERTIPRTQMALVHRGEVIGRSKKREGLTVNVNNPTVNTPMDFRKEVKKAVRIEKEMG